LSSSKRTKSKERKEEKKRRISSTLGFLGQGRGSSLSALSRLPRKEGISCKENKDLRNVWSTRYD
jgi:hypothetical protein